jgi:hypothetical protein
MIDDDKVLVDEERRLAQHEAVRGTVANEVSAEVAANATVATPADQAKAGAVADHFKDKAFSEVIETEREIETTKGVARVSQIVDFVFYVIYALIGMEILLEMLGARDSAGFKKLIDVLSGPFLVPFQGLMPEPSAGPFRLALSYIMALVAYLVLHLIVNSLLRMMAHRKVAV